MERRGQGVLASHFHFNELHWNCADRWGRGSGGGRKPGGGGGGRMETASRRAAAALRVSTLAANP